LNRRMSGVYTAELRRALEEEAFGIKSFSISNATPLRATACVHTLEGHDIDLELCADGYSIKSGAPTTLFDSLDTLLQSISPLYEKERHTLWVQKLEQLTSPDITSPSNQKAPQ